MKAGQAACTATRLDVLNRAAYAGETRLSAAGYLDRFLGVEFALRDTYALDCVISASASHARGQQAARRRSGRRLRAKANLRASPLLQRPRGAVNEPDDAVHDRKGTPVTIPGTHQDSYNAGFSIREAVMGTARVERSLGLP